MYQACILSGILVWPYEQSHGSIVQVVRDFVCTEEGVESAGCITKQREQKQLHSFKGQQAEKSFCLCLQSICSDSDPTEKQQRRLAAVQRLVVWIQTTLAETHRNKHGHTTTDPCPGTTTSLTHANSIQCHAGAIG